MFSFSGCSELGFGCPFPVPCFPAPAKLCSGGYLSSCFGSPEIHPVVQVSLS
jgi:hypothetical protein